MTYYACVDNREILDVHPDLEIPGQSDLAFAGWSYRRLDLTFLAWITQRIQTVLKATKIDHEAIGSAITFAERCGVILGHPDALPVVPSGYTKPSIADDTDWVRDLVWCDGKVIDQRPGKRLVNRN